MKHVYISLTKNVELYFIHWFLVLYLEFDDSGQINTKILKS